MVCVRVHVRITCVRFLMNGGGWGGGYILVMLREFYKLWLTPLPTAD